jgi:hypothetical protein
VIKATQTGKYPEGMLLWQLFDQPVHRMDWREQANK